MGKILVADNISKQYRLGQFGTGTLSHDLNRAFAKMRGKEDPYLKVTEENDRTTVSDSDYVWALRNISFDVEEGEVVGIIGKNGAGKSTLLKLLSRITTPTSGVIKLGGRLGALLEVGTGFHPELTGRENIYLNGAIMGMSKHEIRESLDEIVAFSGCEKYVDTPVKRYSSGMMVRLGFAVAAHLKPEILIIDEVLAVGDLEFQRKCLGKMRDVSQAGRTVLFVSHNMSSISQLCPRTILLKEGQIYKDGKTEDVIPVYKSINADTTYANEKGGKDIWFEKIDSDVEAGLLKIEAKVESKLDVGALTCGFLIKDAWGQKVGTVYHNISINQKGLKLNLKLDINALVSGSYEIDAALFVPNAVNYEYLETCVSFNHLNENKVNSFENQNIGAMHFDCQWNVE